MTRCPRTAIGLRVSVGVAVRHWLLAHCSNTVPLMIIICYYATPGYVYLPIPCRNRCYVHKKSRWHLVTRLHWVRALSPVAGFSAPQHGYGRRTDTACDHDLSKLAQSRIRLDLAPVLARQILSSRPQNLAGGARSRPDDLVQVHRVDRLGPDGHLAPEDELGLVGGQVSRRVMLVDQCPALGRSAPVGEGVERVERLAVVEVQPCASAAVEVLSQSRH